MLWGAAPRARFGFRTIWPCEASGVVSVGLTRTSTDRSAVRLRYCSCRATRSCRSVHGGCRLWVWVCGCGGGEVRPALLAAGVRLQVLLLVRAVPGLLRQIPPVDGGGGGLRHLRWRRLAVSEWIGPALEPTLFLSACAARVCSVCAASTPPQLSRACLRRKPPHLVARQRARPPDRPPRLDLRRLPLRVAAVGVVVQPVAPEPVVPPVGRRALSK